MSVRPPNALDGLLYGAGQAARVAWFAGHYVAGRRLLKPLPRPARPVGPIPDRRELAAALLDLFRRDWRNVAAGLYAAPVALPTAPLRHLARSRDYFRDLPNVDRRRHGLARDDTVVDPRFAELPRYFRQSFHYQSGGYLSDHSARLYDLQVETLFTGAADAMRRQILAPLAAFLRGRNTRRACLLDIGCGTGSLLGAIRRNWPGLSLCGVDLSEPYLAEAGRRLGRSRRLRLLAGAAEALPLPDASQDAIVCSFLFHELPPPVRARVVAEMARVLKPDGQICLLDSLQLGDRPGWDGLLDLFPHHFHEPYYADYVRQDVAALFAAHGLQLLETRLAYLAKLFVFARA